MATLTQYQLSLNNAIWIDVNSQISINNLPDRVPDAIAIWNSSLFNLFNCYPGQRARTFQPRYGSFWLQFLQEPIGPATAAKMQIFMIQAIKEWEPRISLDMNNTSITADTMIPGYVVRIAFSMPGLSVPQQLQFTVTP
jgi:phage baseplate assembly protein W